MDTNAEELLLTQEVASACRISVPTARLWRRQGVGPPSFNLNGRVVYRRSAVLAWIAAQEERSTPPQRELTG